MSNLIFQNLTADTLRSTGTLGGMSIAQTETLKSMGARSIGAAGAGVTGTLASRASPQYR